MVDRLQSAALERRQDVVLVSQDVTADRSETVAVGRPAEEQLVTEPENFGVCLGVVRSLFSLQLVKHVVRDS